MGIQTFVFQGETSSLVTHQRKRVVTFWQTDARPREDTAQTFPGSQAPRLGRHEAGTQPALGRQKKVKLVFITRQVVLP